MHVSICITTHSFGKMTFSECIWVDALKYMDRLWLVFIVNLLSFVENLKLVLDRIVVKRTRYTGTKLGSQSSNQPFSLRSFVISSQLFPLATTLRSITYSPSNIAYKCG